jgi:hypothetical protein
LRKVGCAGTRGRRHDATADADKTDRALEVRTVASLRHAVIGTVPRVPVPVFGSSLWR